MKKLYVLALTLVLTGCTLSFQNIDTHGTATDVVDSEPKNDVQANPDIDVPVSMVPGA